MYVCVCKVIPLTQKGNWKCPFDNVNVYKRLQQYKYIYKRTVDPVLTGQGQKRPWWYIESKVQIISCYI